MSNVDERTVRLNFDNAQFEQGVRKSISTLDLLESVLNKKSGAKGLEKLQSSLNSFDGSKMMSTLESLNGKFSTMGIVGMEVTKRIANGFMDMAKKATSSITGVMNQIKSGGSSRALNLEQARFMLKGLTGDLNKVEQIISGPVNDAVSGTRFGLDAAAVAAANLYASGVTGSEELTKSLQAISGAATMTNREYGDMADIFATVKSNGKLMTMQLRQFSAMGMNVAAQLATELGKSEAEVNEMVTKGKISYDEFVDVMYKYWDLAADANSTYSGSLANVNAQLSKIGEVVATKYYSSMIKVNTALIDFLKAIKTELAPLYKIINGAIDSVTTYAAEFIKSEKTMKAAQNIIKGITNIAKGLQNILYGVGKAFEAAFPKSLESRILSISKKFKKATKAFKDFTSMGEGGQWLKSAKSQKKYSDQLHEIVNRYKEEKKVVSDSLKIKTKNFRFSKEQVKQIKEGTAAYEKETEAQRKANEKRQETVKELDKLIKKYDLKKVWTDHDIQLEEKDAELVKKKLKLTKATSYDILEQIKAYKKRSEAQQEEIANREKTSKQLHDLLKRYKAEKKSIYDKVVMEEKDAQHVKNAFEGRAKTMEQLEKEMKRYDKVRKFHKDMGEEMVRTETHIGQVTDIFNGLFSIVRVGSEIFNGFKTALDPLGERLGALAEEGFYFASTIGAWLDAFNDSIIKQNVIGEFASKVADAIDKLLPTADEIHEWGIKAERELAGALPTFYEVQDAFKDFSKKIKTNVSNIKGSLSKIAEPFINLKDALVNTIGIIKTILVDFYNGFTSIADADINVNGFMDFVEFVVTFPFKVLAKLSSGLSDFTKTVRQFVKESKLFQQIGKIFGFIGKQLGKGAKVIVDQIARIIKSFELKVNSADIYKILRLVFIGRTSEKFTKEMKGVSKNIQNAFKTLSEPLTIISDKFKGLTRLPNTLEKLLGATSKALNEFTTTLKVGQLLIVALSIGVLAASLTALEDVDPEKIGPALSALTMLTLVATVATRSLAKIKDSDGLVSAAASLYIIGLALKQFAKAINIIAESDPDNATMALGVLMVGIYGIYKFAKALSEMDDQISIKSTIAILGYMLAVKILVGELSTLAGLVEEHGANLGWAFLTLVGVMTAFGLFVLALDSIGPDLSVKSVGAMQAYLAMLWQLIGMLAVIALMDKIDPKATTLAFFTLAGLMASLGTFVYAMNAISPDLNLKSAIAVGVYILALGKLVKSLAVIAGLMKIDWAATTAAFVMLEGLMFSLVTVIGLLDGKMMNASGSKTLKNIAMLGAVVLALSSMVKNLTLIAVMMHVDGAATTTAWMLLELLLLSVVATLGVLNSIEFKNQKVADAVTLITTVTASLATMTQSLVEIANSMQGGAGETIGAFALLELILSSVIGVLAILAGMQFKEQNVTSSIALLTTVTAMLSILTANLLTIRVAMAGNGGIEKTLAAFLVLEMVLFSLTGVLAILSNITADPKNILNVIGACSALILLAAALSLITPQIAALSMIGPKAFVGAGALAAFVAVMMALGAVAGKLPMITSGMVQLGLGISAIAAGILILGGGIALIGMGLWNIVKALNYLGKNADTIYKGLAKLPEILAKSVAAILVEIVKTLPEAIMSLSHEIQLTLGAILKAIFDTIITIMKSIIEYAPQIISLAVELVIAVADTITQHAVDLVTAATNLIIALADGLIQNMNRLVDAAFRLVISFLNGFSEAIDKNGPKLRSAIKKLIKAMVKFVKDGIKDLKKAGGQLIDGLIKGIKSKFKSLKDAVTGLGGKISGWIKDKLKIKSPSRVFMEIGAYTMAGFIKGVTNGESAVKSEMLRFGATVIDSAMSALDEHSPSMAFFKIGEFCVEGFINGINSKSKAGIKAINTFFKNYADSAMEIFSGFNLGNKTNGAILSDRESKVVTDKTRISNLKAQNKEANKGLKQMVTYSASRRKLTKAEKEELKVYKAKKKANKELTKKEQQRYDFLTKSYAKRKTRRKDLTKSEKTELAYLQQKLQVEGTLSDKEYRRMGVLLGFTKTETQNLEYGLDLRKETTKQLEKEEKQLKKDEQVLKAISAYTKNNALSDVNFAFSNQLYETTSKVLAAYGEALYKQTDEYKDNTAAMEANNAEIKTHNSNIDALKKTQSEYTDKLYETENRLYKSLTTKGKVNNLSKKEAAQLDTLTKKYDKTGKLTDAEWKSLAKLYGWKTKDVKTIKSQYKEMHKLEKKLEKNGKLTDEEILKLADYYGIKGKNLDQIKADIKLRTEQKGIIQNSKDGIASEKDAINELTTVNEELADAIQNGTVTALQELANTIKDNVKSALDPLSTSLSDAVDMLSKFSATAIEFELPFKVSDMSEDDKSKAEKVAKLAAKNFNEAVIEKLKDESEDTIDYYLAMDEAAVNSVNSQISKTIISNLASYGKAYSEWKEGMTKLVSDGKINDALIKRLQEMGPEGLNLVKAYLSMTDEEIKQANAAMVTSTNATLDEWIETNKRKAEQQKKFYEDLNKLRANGLSQDAYEELQKQGYDAAGALVEGLLTNPSRIADVNSIYKTYEELPEEIADYAVMSAATAAESGGVKLGQALYDGFFGGFVGKLSDAYTLSNFTEPMQQVIDKMTENANAQGAGAQAGVFYIDGMIYAMNDEGELTKMTTAGETVGLAANDGVEKYLSKSNGKTIGKNLDEGLASGISNKKASKKVEKAAIKVAENAYNAAISFLQCHSPSKLFSEVGMNVDLGFAEGMDSYSDKVYESAKGIGVTSYDAIRESLDRVGEFLTGENAPVITPILDLSNVEVGAVRMKKLFDSAHIATDATVDAIADGQTGAVGNQYQFIQNNYSPKALSRIEIYRQTKNQFAMLKGASI